MSYTKRTDVPLPDKLCTSKNWYKCLYHLLHVTTICDALTIGCKDVDDDCPFTDYWSEKQ